MPLVPDYLAALADLEAYPDTLSADIASAYEVDLADARTSIGAEYAEQINTLTILNGQLQEFNAALLARVGVSDDDDNDNDNDGDDDNADADDEQTRGENISLDDLQEDEDA